MVNPAIIPLALPMMAYLDARWSIRNDLRILSGVTFARIQMRINEAKDRCSAFYTLENAAQSVPDKVFLWYNYQEYTFGEAYKLTLQHATWLKERFGIKKGDVVALDFMNKPSMIWLWFGLWALGAKPALINYNLTGAALVHCVNISSAELVFVDADVNNNVGATSAQQQIEEGLTKAGRTINVVVFGEELDASVSKWQQIRPDDDQRSGDKANSMAALIYTSGTTGLPKPAIVSWWKVTGASKFVGRWMGLKSDDRYFTSMPLYHSSATCFCLMACLQAQITCCLAPKFSASNFFNEVRASRATIIQYVGETCRYLMNTPTSSSDTDHNVRMAFGNGLRGDIWDKFRTRFNISTIGEFYGATEMPVALWNYNTGSRAVGAIGVNGALLNLVHGSTVAIVAIDIETESILRDPVTGFCTKLPRGTPGEMICKIDENDIGYAYQGYLNNEKASNSKLLRGVFVKNDAWLRTGDIIRWDADGLVFFQDRIGETYRFKSENVSTTEVSNTINILPFIADSCVYGIPIPKLDGNAGVAAVVLKNLETGSGVGVEQAMTEIHAHLSKSLPKFAIPSFIRVVQALEYTGNNKIMKGGLRKAGVSSDLVDDGTVWWLRGDKYEKFGNTDWDSLTMGRAKL